jgi:hypothetical protein
MNSGEVDKKVLLQVTVRILHSTGITKSVNENAPLVK